MKKQTITSRIEKLCAKNGVKITHQRRIIADVISKSNDHPDANEVYLRSNKLDPRISLATVYRTIKLFEEHNVLNRIELGGKRARYEELNEDDHHDHAGRDHHRPIARPHARLRHVEVEEHLRPTRGG